MKKSEKFEKAGDLWRRASALENRGKIADPIKLYLLAAKLGDASAQSNLANLLDDKLTPPRPKEAVYWYKRAVKSGNFLGAKNFAVQYKT